MKKYRFFIPVFAALFFAACSPQTTIRLNTDNSAAVSFKMDSGKIIQSLLQGMGIAQENTPLFDAAQIQSALSEAGLTVTEISFPSQTALNLTATSPDIQKLLPEQTGFIRLSKTGTLNTLKLKLNPQTVQQAVALLPRETGEFLDLLIAPIFTGENIPPEEYVELIGVAYGASAASELKKARFTLSITVPAAVKSATASNKNAAPIAVSGNTATFTLNLVSFLTDLRTTDYEVTW